MRRLTIETDDPRETERLASAIGAVLPGGTVLALDGPLGAGKTCFVRGLARGLGIDAHAISSPTFGLMHRHEGRDGLELQHLDLHRLGGPEDLETLEWDEVGAAGGIAAIEWADRAGDALGEGVIHVRFEHRGPSRRSIELEAGPGVDDATWSSLARAAGPWTAEPDVAACPICGRSAPGVRESGGFCSERCRRIDLARWFDEGYRISRPLQFGDEFDELE